MGALVSIVQGSATQKTLTLNGRVLQTRDSADVLQDRFFWMGDRLLRTDIDASASNEVWDKNGSVSLRYDTTGAMQHTRVYDQYGLDVFTAGAGSPGDVGYLAQFDIGTSGLGLTPSNNAWWAELARNVEGGWRPRYYSCGLGGCGGGGGGSNSGWACDPNNPNLMASCGYETGKPAEEMSWVEAIGRVVNGSCGALEGGMNCDLCNSAIAIPTKNTPCALALLCPGRMAQNITLGEACEWIHCTTAYDKLGLCGTCSEVRDLLAQGACATDLHLALGRCAGIDCFTAAGGGAYNPKIKWHCDSRIWDLGCDPSSYGDFEGNLMALCWDMASQRSNCLGAAPGMCDCLARICSGKLKLRVNCKRSSGCNIWTDLFLGAKHCVQCDGTGGRPTVYLMCNKTNRNILFHELMHYCRCDILKSGGGKDAEDRAEGCRTACRGNDPHILYPQDRCLCADPAS